MEGLRLRGWSFGGMGELGDISECCIVINGVRKWLRIRALNFGSLYR